MTRALYILFTTLAVTLLLVPVSFAHKYHTSVTRVEYNQAERSAEITIQTFTDDLRDVLTKRAGKTVRLEAGKVTDRLAFDYLRSAFELKDGNAATSELQWVGMEIKGETVWLYALAKMPSGLAKATLRNSFLFDLFDDQVNIVNVLHDGQKSSLVFKRGDGSREIP
jgi:hypothetical protein